jgi:heptosyltransferase-3
MGDRLHHLRRTGKRLLVTVLGGLGPRCPPIPIDQVDLSHVGKVLLIRPNFRMGNLLITTSALPILRGNFPDARIDMLCAATFSALLEHQPHLDGLHTVTRAQLFNPVRLLSLMRRVRRERYDLVIDGTLTGSASLLTQWSGGRVRIGAAPPERAFAYTACVPEPARQIWRVEAMRRFLQSIGLTVPDVGAMAIGLGDEERSAVRDRWAQMGWDEKTWVTGVFVGARGDKAWPPERWGVLITRLWEDRGPGEGIVVFHGREELALIETLRRLLPAEHSPGVRDFAALVSRCRQFVTCDTGPMHLASAVGVPVVSLFFRRSWTRFAPQGPTDVVVFNETMPSPEEVLEAHGRQRAKLGSGGDPAAAEGV